MRLLFCSYHCFVDPSSGAALATRDLLESLAGRGWECRVLCGPHLDFEEDQCPGRVLSNQQFAFLVRYSLATPLPFALAHARLGQVPVTIYSPSATDRSKPSREEGLPFLALLVRAVESFDPKMILTYGGHWLAKEVIACAKRRGVPVVFALHNLAYQDQDLFQSVDAVLVPSHFAQSDYRRRLGLDCTSIPSLMNWARVRCEKVDGRYVTFVNPQPEKGVFIFARIAAELARRRPDIPLLVVEGRGRAGWLDQTGIDLRSLPNLYVMANTHDPRDFYRVSRMVLVPSLCQESFGLVAAEALINGLPVLASRRGALAETLQQAGFLFDVPERYTPESRLVPSAEEVAPWIDTIVALWDDSPLYEAERRRCLAAAEEWRPEQLTTRHERFLSSVVQLLPS